MVGRVGHDASQLDSQPRTQMAGRVISVKCVEIGFGGDRIARGD
jgi:hypothetical protein